MFTKEEPMSLKNIGDGAAIEKFDKELQRVLDNLVDPNTDPKKARSITLKVTLKPQGEDRQNAIVLVDVSNNLVADKPFISSCMLGKSGKVGHAREIKNNQQEMFKTNDNVTDINEGREAQ